MALSIIKGLGDPAPEANPSIVIVAGHRVDTAGQAERFPESAVEAVTGALLQQLLALNKPPGGIRVLASAAPGTDIIAHEICHKNEIKRTICLPMPRQNYAQETFGPDGWRARFLTLTEREDDILTLNEAPGLPAWLQATDTNEWERGNYWVLQMALSARAPRVSLIAVWDGKAMGETRGGTAHMVQIANAAGTVDVIYVDPKTGAVSRIAPVVA